MQHSTVTTFDLYYSTGDLTGSWLVTAVLGILRVFQTGPQTVPVYTIVSTGIDTPFEKSYF